METRCERWETACGSEVWASHAALEAHKATPQISPRTATGRGSRRESPEAPKTGPSAMSYPLFFESARFAAKSEISS